MSDMSTSRGAGWYHAEGDPPGTQRYWDGAAWQGGPQVSPDGALGAASVGATAVGAPPTAGSVMPEVMSPETSYKGFFPTLFDLSLNSFLAPKVVRVLYIIGLVLICIGTLAWAVILAATGGGTGIAVGLLVVPLFGLLYLLILRIQAEFVIVSFRTYEQLRALRAELDARD